MITLGTITIPVAIGAVLSATIGFLAVWLLVVAPIAALIKPQDRKINRHGGPLGPMYTRDESGTLGSTRAFGHTILLIYAYILAGIVIGVVLTGIMACIGAFLAAI